MRLECGIINFDMNNNPLVQKLRLLTSGMDKVQLADLLAQMKARDYTQITAWFISQNNPLTAQEIESFQDANKGVIYIYCLIGDWYRERRTAFIADSVKDDLKPIRLTVIDRAVLAGETEDYGADIFLNALKSLVEELSNG